MESTHSEPLSQAPASTSPNAPRRLFWALTFAQLPGWQFEVWIQANGLYFASGHRRGLACLTIDGDVNPVALEALNDCQQKVFGFLAAEASL